MSSTIRNPSGHRPEIDGLRAIAVISVLLFHIDLALFSGGFVGVDIFFVISGYLITRNIQNAIKQDNFSLSRFYISRLRRLYPALLATISISTIAALFIFSPEHLLRFSKEVISSLFSFSNFYFWSESGYFDLDENFKPLLHTWSLSVEEQFYLLWPSLILIISRIKKSLGQISIFIVVGITSLFLAERLVQQDFASTAFYMLPFRAIEFIIGAIILFLPDLNKTLSNRSKSAITITGLIVTLYPIFQYSRITPFPGFSALIPCIGTALIIWSGSNSASSLILQNKPSQWIGKTSYSIYLVHWPLIVFWQYLNPGTLTNLSQLIIFILSLSLGYLSWRWIEQPFRYTERNNLLPLPRKFKTFALSLFAITIASITLIVKTQGNVLQKSTTLTADQVAKGKTERFKLIRKGCNVLDLGNTKRCNMSAPQQTLIFGNSHEPDGYNIWTKAYESPDQNIITFGTTNQCEAFIENRDSDLPDTRNCRKRLSILLNKDFILSLNTIVYSSNMPFAKNKEKTLDLLASIKEINPNLQFIILGGYFNLRKDCSFYIAKLGSIDACLNSEFINYDSHDEEKAMQNWFNSRQATILKPIYINKFKLLCEQRMEQCQASANNVPFTYDQHHLSFEFSQLIGSRLSAKYAQLTTSN